MNKNQVKNNARYIKKQRRREYCQSRVWVPRKKKSKLLECAKKLRLEHESKVINDLRLPWPPSVNSYWRCSKGRVILSQAARRYRRNVIDSLWAHLSDGGLLPTFGQARLAVTVTMRYSSNKKYDLDNFNKGILDALQESGLFADDGQIDDLRIIRGEISKNDPHVLISILALD